MADYKRMVSYMYQYENGVKRKNVGYARVESKGGQCKITIHMQLLGLLDSIFPTYLIQRENKELELVYLGDSVLKNQVMDSKLTADEANIMGSGYKLSDFGGILLFLNDNVFYATEWDDKPIIASEVLEALKPKPKKVVNNSESGFTLQTDMTLNNVQEYKEENEIDNILWNNMQQEEDTSATVYNTEALLENRPEDSIQEEGNQDSFEENIFFQSSPASTPQDSLGLTLEEELKIPKYKLPRGWKTVEMFQRTPPFSENEDFATEKNEAIKAADSDNSIYSNEESIIEATGEAEAEETVMSDLEEAMSRTYQNEDDKPEPPIAAHFFEHYPRIYPFEDNEITFCVKIEPKDIGLLPKDLWGLSNNSFLVHGYYCYHHLIFAKMKDRFGCRYILGIPGIYHNREQFMARMFGFEGFKSIRKRDLRQGDFGYWYIPISL